MNVPSRPTSGGSILQWAEEVCEYLEQIAGNRPRAGSIWRPKAGKLGTGAGATVTHPFKVSALAAVAATEENPTPPPRLVVEIDSWLVKGLNMDDKVTITGLGEPFDCVPGDDQSFFVWIKAEISTGVATAVTIEHGTSEDLWDGPAAEASSYPSPVRFTDDAPPVQDRAYLLLAAITPPVLDGGEKVYPNRESLTSGSGDEAFELQIAQCVTTNLILCEGCVDGRKVLVFGPWHAPGPA